MTGNRKRESRMNSSKKNAGTTMVEVLVAFLVVMIMVGMFSQVVAASVHMLNQSRGVVKKMEKFNEEYYKTEAAGKMEPVGEEPGGSPIVLVVDETRTDSTNKAKEVDIKLAKSVYQKYKHEQSGITRYSFGTKDSSFGKK